MQLSGEQIEEYVRDGYLLILNCFSDVEIDLLKAQLPSIFEQIGPERVLEKGTNQVRSVYGSHTSNQVCASIVRDVRLVMPAQSLLHSEVYVHQFKVNAKLAFVGDVWKWHQDYIFWQKEDGMPAARVLTAMLFLDDVTEFNGPLLVVPGSHTHGVVDGHRRTDISNEAPDWAGDVAADLSYTLSNEYMTRIIKASGGIASPKGPAGSVLFFDANLAHASGPNMSSVDRKAMFITYNSVLNAPVNKARPDFLCSRDYAAINSVHSRIPLFVRN